MEEVEKMLKERGDKYGEYGEFARTCQALKREVRSNMGWYKDMPDYIHESIDMILHKITRIVNGDAREEDNLLDIIGYAEIALKELRKEKKKEEELSYGYHQ